ncbi:MAG: molybdopterin-dependent oxidoreductase [Nitrospirae bacterium]|nr:molybdopterin-dependent oxidoreductase [Nitrospirota bacterium]
MKNFIKLTIDGREVQVPEGVNLLDAAELAGVHIPNLCYLKGTKGIGACRLCLVEVDELKAPIIGCTTKAKDGMVVHTKTEKVQETRKFIIDLILSMHPLDCMTCTKAGVCNLQKYAYDFEIKESGFTRKKFGYPVDETNPFIKRDPDYCILCGKCVRVCKNQGTNVLEFMGRGVGARVVTANDKPLQESDCTFCGSCVDACPVNALLESDRWRKGREWEYEKANSVCLLCGNGCEITVSTKDGRIAKINSGAPEGSAERFICAYGRFGFDCIEAETRVTAPMKRVGNELRETTWEDAIKTVAERLKKAEGESGIISTAGILNEDAVALKQLAAILNTKNIDTSASLYSDADSMKNETAEIETADMIMLVGINPDQWKRVLPALDAAIRKRVNSGVKLIVINSGDTNISSVATLNIQKDEARTISEIAQAVISSGGKAPKEMVQALASVDPSDEAVQAAKLFTESKKPLILSSPALYDASANISMIKGTAVAIPVESNAKGVTLMGLVSEGKSFREMTNDGMKVLYAIGEIPLNKRPKTDFLIIQNSHMTALAKEADIVLPSAAFLETSGTIVDYLGRLRYLCQAVEPAGDAQSHREIFMEISKASGKAIKEAKDTDIKKALKFKAKVTLKPFQKKEGFDINPQEMIESINASVINGARLLWLKESEKAMAV